MAVDLLEQAIINFENPSLNMTLGDRISELRRALMWNAVKTIKLIHKEGKKSQKSEEEEWKHLEFLKQFKIIETMYTSEVKQGKLLHKPQEAIENDFLKRIKEMKGAVGDIVRDLKTQD